jgi:hypothetical protein
MMTQTRSRAGAASGAASALGASSGYSGSSACAPGSQPASAPKFLAIRCSWQPAQAGRGRSSSRPGGALPTAPCSPQAQGAGKPAAGRAARAAPGAAYLAPLLELHQLVAHVRDVRPEVVRVVGVLVLAKDLLLGGRAANERPAFPCGCPHYAPARGLRARAAARRLYAAPVGARRTALASACAAPHTACCAAPVRDTGSWEAGLHAPTNACAGVRYGVAGQCAEPTAVPGRNRERARRARRQPLKRRPLMDHSPGPQAPGHTSCPLRRAGYRARKGLG